MSEPTTEELIEVTRKLSLDHPETFVCQTHGYVSERLKAQQATLDAVEKVLNCQQSSNAYSVTTALTLITKQKDSEK